MGGKGFRWFRVLIGRAGLLNLDTGIMRPLESGKLYGFPIFGGSMTNRILGAAVFMATMVLSASTAFAAYQTSSAPVSTSMVLSVSGPSTASTFTNGFKADIANALNISPSRIKVQNIQSGEAPSGRRMGGGFADSGTGAAAGDGENRFGVWSNFSGTGFSESQSAIESSGQIYTFAVGGDYRINDWVMAGLSAGYERQNINTSFNQGTWDSNGAVVSPYVLVQLIPNQLYLDASVGYVGQSIDLSRSNGSINADTTGTRFFMSSNLTATLDYGNVSVRPTMGAMWMYQGISGYQESGTGGQNVDDTTVHFGRFIAGGQVGYNFESVQPFLMAQYQYDYKYDLPTVGPGQVQPTAYKNSALVGGGLLFYLSPRFSCGAQFGAEVGKVDYISYTGSATVRYAF